MNRQIRNLVISMALTTFAGLGLTALAQSPSCAICERQGCAQPTCAQPTCGPVCPQPTCAPVCAQPTCCADPCVDKRDLGKRIEHNADRLRSHFKHSLECVDDCEKDNYRESVRNFERATDDLRSALRDDCADNSAIVNEVLDLAHCISPLMDPCRLDEKANAAWTALQSDLQTLAAQYCTSACFQEPITLQQECCEQPSCCPAPTQTCCPSH
jgi:hypothetical protein